MCVLRRFSQVQLLETLWTIACQASLSMKFFRKKYWSGLPCLGDLPNPGIKPASLMSPLAPWFSIFFFFLNGVILGSAKAELRLPGVS